MISGCGGAAQAERDGEGERRDDDGGVERAVGELVSDVRPGRLDRQRDVEALVGEEAELMCDDDRGRVGQAQEADRDLRAPAARSRGEGESSLI